MSLRTSLLAGAKLAGGFWLAERVKPAGIPILCYHGFSMADEHRFRPALFIRPDEFERRLSWLQRNRYKVIPLAEAIERLDRGALGKRELVITIDDGFHSVGKIGWPLLKDYRFPATLYTTTYYAKHPNPIFRLAIQYFFWRTRRSGARFDDLAPVAPAGEAAMWPLIHWAESSLTEDARCELARSVAARLDVDYEELRSSRRLSLLTTRELQALASDGLDLELHTHRHNLPEDAGAIEREIADNRGVLQAATDKTLRHFCYPSGVWSRDQWRTLASLGIESATTCTPGFNRPDTPRLALHRFLDSEDLSQRDFEAELTGFKTLLRTLRRAA
jgi:peptidoglycan/xylan/chitin deacetylase (PgdA/CDA1 family)